MIFWIIVLLVCFILFVLIGLIITLLKDLNHSSRDEEKEPERNYEVAVRKDFFSNKWGHESMDNTPFKTLTTTFTETEAKTAVKAYKKIYKPSDGYEIQYWAISKKAKEKYQRKWRKWWTDKGYTV